VEDFLPGPRPSPGRVNPRDHLRAPGRAARRDRVPVR